MGKDNIIQISKPVQKSLETNDTHIKLELTKQGTPWRRESDNPPIEDLPDGGWGWLIVISSMIIHLIVGKIFLSQILVHVYRFCSLLLCGKAF